MEMNPGTMQNMVGPRGGVPGPQQQQVGMQRNNAAQQVQKLIYQSLQHDEEPVGWQRELTPVRRTMMIFQLVTSLRLVKPELSINAVIEVATRFERKIYTDSVDKNNYDAQCHAKLADIASTRSKQAASLQQLQDSNGSQVQMFPQQIPGQNGIPVQMQGQFQQGFPNLQMQQPPMQPSPMPVQQIPMQQTQPGLINPSMIGNQPPIQQTQQTLQNLPRQVPQGPQLIFSAEENRQIQELARQVARNTQQADMDTIKQRLQSVPVEQRQDWLRRGLDPLAYYFRQIAINHFKNEKSRMRGTAAGQQSQGPISQGNNFNSQQPQPISRNPSNNQGQSFGPVNATPSFEQSFPGNTRQNQVTQIRNTQQEGLRSQELGQMVVPVSGIQRTLQQQQPQPQPQPSRVTQVAPQQQPSHLPNQARSTPTPTNAQQQHLQAQQHQKEKMQQAAARMQPQVKIAMGAQGQLPQQAPLQGQLGGLTGQIGQGPLQQSPAMPNLNRPLGPSMSQNQGHGNPQTQGTPQSRPQQRTTQNQAQNFESSLSQQSLHKQQQQQQQSAANPAGQSTMQQRMSQMIANLPDVLKQRLNNMPEVDRKNFLLGLLQQRALQQRQQQISQSTIAPNIASLPAQNLPAGLQQQSHAQLFGQDTFRQPQGSQIPQLAGKNNQQQLSGGVSHPYPGQLQGQMQQMIPNQQPIQNRPVQMLTEEQVRQMDHEEFPPNMLSSQAVLQHVPQEVKMWGQLKSWVAQNMHIMPANILEKLKGLQILHFHNLVNTRRRPQQVPNPLVIQPPISAPQQGPAPPAQMVQMPNQQPPTFGQNLLQMSTAGRLPQMQPPTLEYIQATRPKLPENMRGMTDEQLRQLIMQKQYRQMMQAVQNQQNQQNQQNRNVPQINYEALQQAQQAQRQQAQRQLMQMQANQPAQAQKHQQIGQQPSAVPQNVRKIGGQANAKGPVQGQTARQVPQPPNQSSAPQKGLKRSNTDDVIEVPNPNIVQVQEQRIQNQGKQNQPKQKTGVAQNAQDQATPASQPARAQYEVELRRQAAQGDRGSIQQNIQQNSQPAKPSTMQINPGRPSGEDEKKQRWIQIMNQVNQVPYTRKPVPMDRQTREKMVNQFKENRKMIVRMEASLPMLFQLLEDETLTRELMNTRQLLIRQFRDKDFNLVDQFTIGPEELDGAISNLKQHFNIVIQKAEQKRSQINKSGTASNNVPQNPAATTSQVSIPPLNAANLQQNQQAELQVLQAQRQTSLQRNNSNRDNRAPAAPTSSQPPFSFGAQSPSPHGVPQYNFPAALTQEMLALPRTKKRKTNEANSTATTPAQMNGTPGPAGPAQVKNTPVEMRRLSAPSTRVKCPVVDCPLAKQDYATVEDLAKHTAEAHEVKEPIIEDPLAYALESIRFGLGLDEHSEIKPNTDSQKDEKIEMGFHEMKTSTSMQGQTPLKQEGSTPMSRIPTQTGSLDSSSLIKTPHQSSGLSKSVLSNVKMLESKGSQMNTTKVTSTARIPSPPPKDPWDDNSVSPAALSACFPTLEDLNDSLSLSILTPTSTLSSQKSEKNSPKHSDIGEDDLLKIRIEADSWQAPELFRGAMFATRETEVVDDEILGMDWEAIFGTSSVLVGKTTKKADAWGNNTQGFDSSLFSVNL